VRLLFVSHSFPPEHSPLENIGGMQRVAVELANQLANRDDLDYQQLILQSSWNRHHIQCIPWLLATTLRLYRRASKHQMDVVLFSSMVTGAIAPLIRNICKATNIKLCAIAHGRDVTLPGIYQVAQVRRTLRALDRVYPVSHATANECAVRGMDQSRIQVIPNGVNLDRYSFGSGGQGKSLQLLSVGRLVTRKGFRWFVNNVMPLLPSNIHYKIAGFGPEHDAINSDILARGLQERIQLLGRCSDQSLVKLYHDSDLLIMPNLHVEGDMEGFGVVMLEAGASGTPAIASDIEGIRDVITDGKNGTLIPSGNAEAFKTAILDHASFPDRTLVRKHTESNFSWPIVAQRYIDHLKRLHTGTLLN